MSKIRLYLKIWAFGLKKGLQYPANIYFSILQPAPSFFFAAVLWTRAVEQNEVVGVYDLGSLLRYYLVTRILAAVMSFETDWDLWQDIKDGTLSQHLTHPVNYLLYKFMGQMGQDTVNMISCPLMVALGYLAFPSSLSFATGLDVLALSFVAIVNGLVFAKMLAYLRGSLAFWLHDSGPFAWVDRLAIGLLAGYYIPFGVLPAGIRRVLLLLPFQSLLSTPTETLLGVLDFNTALRLTAVNIGWTLVAGSGLSLLWRSGLRRYEALGG